MAKLLSAIGRSRAIPRALQAFSDRETAEVNREVALEDVGIRQAAELRNQTKFNRETKAFEEKEALLNSPLNITTHPMFLGLPDEVKDSTLQFFKDQGAIDERGIGTTRNVRDVMQKIESTKGLFEQFMAPVVQIKKNQFLELDKQVRELQATDPQSPKLEKLIQQRDIAEKTYRQSEGGFLKHQRKLGEIEAIGEEARKTELAKPVKLTSIPGKQAQDREILARKFGEDSKEVQNFDKALTVTSGTTAVQQETIFSKIQDDARQHANSIVPKAGASFSFGDDSVSFTGGGRDVEAWKTARDEFLNEQVTNAVGRGNLNESFLEGLSEPLPTPTPQTFTTKDGETVTQADISFTAQQENISEDEVKKRLGIE